MTVSANASDNVGVAGVQFYLDGALLGTEDTTALYGVSSNPTTATNASHTLLARARDAAGNITNSAPLTVTVSNPDTTAPTVAITAPTGTLSGIVTVSANASDNVGVAGVQFYLDGALLGTEDTTAPYSVSWNTTTATNATTRCWLVPPCGRQHHQFGPAHGHGFQHAEHADSRRTCRPSVRLESGTKLRGRHPNRTTVFTTVFPGGNIQAAIDAAPPGQVVQLAAGTFTVNNYLLIDKGITLRGTVDPVTNAPLTFLQKTNGATAGSDTATDYQPIIIVGPTRWPQIGTSTNLTSDAVAGTYSITLASTAGLSPGQFVILDEAVTRAPHLSHCRTEMALRHRPESQLQTGSCSWTTARAIPEMTRSRIH